jgi:hypothetical protein
VPPGAGWERRFGARLTSKGGGRELTVGEVRAIPKDEIRFAVALDGGAAAQLVIRVRQDRFGGWEAIALLHQGDGSPAALGRVFRSRERRLAVGKMVAWARRRYVHARPLAACNRVARGAVRS